MIGNSFYFVYFNRPNETWVDNGIEKAICDTEDLYGTKAAAQKKADNLISEGYRNLSIKCGKVLGKYHQTDSWELQIL